ncbi:MAG: LytTR family DNA-binding domain-containing protein [Bacteroidota bacterium]
MEGKLTAVIIDDEASARRNLRQLLEAHQQEVFLVGEADSVTEGVELIHIVQPRLVFLDIEMPPHTSFELLSHFPQPSFATIFTTAHSQYAIQAIRASAIDYLLKPVAPRDLAEALQRVQHFQAQHTRMDVLKENLQRPTDNHKIALSSLDAWVFVDKSNIMYLEAARRYTLIVTAQGEHVASKPLSHFESILTEPHFFRSHRSYIVNLKFVKKLVKREGGYIEMQDATQIKISPQLRDPFIEQCQKFG